MQLAGTCSRYLKSAIPQLTIAATYHGRSAMFFKWAYHSKVMNTLDATSSRTVINGLDGMKPIVSRETGGISFRIRGRSARETTHGPWCAACRWWIVSGDHAAAGAAAGAA